MSPESEVPTVNSYCHSSLARAIFIFMGCALTFWGARSARADRIVTKDGRTITGIVIEENFRHVTIDVRGKVLNVPRTRIGKVYKEDVQQNVKTMLDQATEALGRHDLMTARSLLDQTRLMDIEDQPLRDRLEEVEALATELERRGGTPEERRRNAESYFNRALEAFDKMKAREGNELLLEAVKSDQTYEPAQERLEEYFISDSNDLDMMGAYFYEAMWPDHLRLNSPVFERLPEIYDKAIGEFGRTTDVVRASYLARVVKSIFEGVAQHPEWIMNAAPGTAEKFQPSNYLPVMSDQTLNNIERKQYDLALGKAQTFARPVDSAETALLFSRIYAGLNDLEEAAGVLAIAASQFPESRTLRDAQSGLILLRTGRTAQNAGNQEAARFAYEEIYRDAGKYPYEIVARACASLAVEMDPQLETAEAQGPPWRAADVAALVMIYGATPERREQATEIFRKNLPLTAWRPVLEWEADGETITLDTVTHDQMRRSVTRSGNLKVDDRSPFQLEVTVKTGLSRPMARQLAIAVASGNPQQLISDNPPLKITSMKIEIKAIHPALGTLWSRTSRPDSLPEDVARRQGAAPGSELSFLTLDRVEALRRFIEVDLPYFLAPMMSSMSSELHIPTGQEAQERRLK